MVFDLMSMCVCVSERTKSIYINIYNTELVSFTWYTDDEAARKRAIGNISIIIIMLEIPYVD